MVYIFYHYRKGKITAHQEEFNRDELIGSAKVGDMNEKDTEESKTQQINKKIIEMERKCHEQIKDHEKMHLNEMGHRSEGEKAIQMFRA